MSLVDCFGDSVLPAVQYQGRACRHGARGVPKVGRVYRGGYGGTGTRVGRVQVQPWPGSQLQPWPGSRYSPIPSPVLTIAQYGPSPVRT